MTASEVEKMVSQAISSAEERAFEATVSERAAEGWSNPTLQAQNEWQGHDNFVVVGTFAEALEDLVRYGEVPTGCAYFDPEEEGDTPEAKQAHLISVLSHEVVGTGEPLAFVGTGGYFTLIRDGATVAEIERAATDCLPSSEGEE